METTTTVNERVPRRPPSRGRPLTALRELWRARELLRNLIVRDLKVRYKHSALGFAWSLVTPLAMMAIFTFIFTQIFRAGIPDFSIFFLAGFLPWQYFSNSVASSVDSIVGNGNLIKKVYFPREVLPLSLVLSQCFHFVLSLVVFGVYLLTQGYNFLPRLHLLILAILFQTLFNSGLAMIFAAANVGFRDLKELVPTIFLLWFYGTPVIYSLDQVPAKYQTLLMLNPLTQFTELYRHILYRLAEPSPRLLWSCVAIAIGCLVVGYALFNRLALTFAKEV